VEVTNFFCSRVEVTPGIVELQLIISALGKGKISRKVYGLPCGNVSWRIIKKFIINVNLQIL